MSGIDVLIDEDLDVDLTAEELAFLAASDPSPMDDLVTGVRVMSTALWTRTGIPNEVRGRMREWVRAAVEMLACRVPEPKRTPCPVHYEHVSACQLCSAYAGTWSGT